jgi:hypothetical protein
VRKPADDQAEEIARQIADEYDKNLRSSVSLVVNELLRRLDPNAIVSIPRISEAETGTPISLYSMVPSTGFGQLDTMIMCHLADETERLAKMLPTKGSH